VEVEIEVDVEVQDDGSVVSEGVAEGDGVPVGEETGDTIGVTGDDAAIVGEEVTPDDVVHEENQDVTTLNAEKRERSEAEDTGATAMDDDNTQGSSSAETTTTKQIIRKTELRTETRPISNALRALQHTFVSLTPRNGQSASSGTTQALCRSLGINPFIQQDGQEFWKLFVPELNYDKMTQLYSGYFDDYVREILPESDNDSNCEEKKDKEGDHVGKPRERVRTEQFLDLSIPVAEGMG
jgi:ubiquitin carboxyl-terminal hydrolase 7